MGERLFKDIVFIGSAGMSGALKLADKYPDEVGRRFPGHILRELGEVKDNFLNESFLKKMSGIRDLLSGRKSVVVKTGNKGVSAALWELGEMLGSGFKIFAERIPVSQITVEICEIFGEDPYRCDSEGCLIVCLEKGNELCSKMTAFEGIKAAIIGHTEEGIGKRMVFGDITRYIDKPR